MSPSPYRSATRFAIAALALAGCGDDRCGPDGAPDVGLVAGNDAVTLTYGGLTGGLNGDCPAQGAPSDVISLTILGTQTEGSGFVTLCVSRPDLLTTQAQPIALDDPASTAAEVRVVDLAGMANGCRFAVDRTRPATGTVSSTGMCGNGGDPAGFAVVVDGALALTRTCGAAIDSIPITLRGRVAVSPP